ncbi:MAG: cytochrome c-type biosis protein CcmF [Solirubrobacteraceae bacterium]|jgi:cytochrome c-type biogenesis protein CcmF|nr:cytochrome c-type biosis protein CcmF [Solirubrobacteraceae bacterium]
MATLGRACLILALAICLYGIVASVYGARTGRREWVASGRRSVYALAGVLTVAFAVLEAAFLRSDFAFDVVASHSSTTTPNFYKATAAWSSQEGSLLLWVWLLSLWSSLVLFAVRRRARQVQPWATAILLAFGAFFAGLTLFLADPFAVSSPAPLEGSGLNPLLRHPSMMVHPPMLYSGYTLFTIPFAFAAGALIARRLDAEWIAVTRRFSLAAWFCLGVGILLGARWSYVELGWGGYWGWDPVENASLLPWLTGTAFLHSVMIQEKRGMLKVWNVSLVLATGILAILGTFLVRSGILDSIHAFGASTLGRPFLVLIALLVAGSIGLVVSRRRELRSEHRLDSLMSREAVFLLNNLVLVGLAFVVFWGTFFPLISEALTGTKASVGPPWFDRYTVPLALVLVLLAGIGPVIAWRAASPAHLWRQFRLPLAAPLVVVGAGLAGGLGEHPAALVMFALAAFVLAAVGQEFWRGTLARRAMTREPVPVALLSLVRRNRRRYGGYLVHAGMAVLFVGVAASSAFQANRDVRMRPGQSARVNGYDVRYVRATTGLAGEKISLGAVLDVSRGGRHVTTLRPTRGYYPSTDPSLGPVARYFDGQATSEVGLRAGLRRDLWMAVEPDVQALEPFVRDADRRFGRAPPQLQGLLIAAIAERYRRHPAPATFRIIVSPLVSWIWLGALIVVLGALVALWPAPAAVRRRATSAYARRVAREVA